jgi:uncharacterized damage-inducible protein DinB
MSEAAALLEYFGKVHQRTMRVARTIPADKVEWQPREGAFSPGDLVRHIAVTNRYTFAENIQGKPSRYTSHAADLANGLDAVLEFAQRLHLETTAIFSGLSEEQWNDKVQTADGVPITRWKLLRLMLEHEVHHRGELYAYLGLLGVTVPPLYGLTSEELRARAAV